MKAQCVRADISCAAGLSNFSRVTCHDVEKVINFVLVKNSDLRRTLGALDRVVELVALLLIGVLAFEPLLLLSRLLVGALRKLELLGVVDVAVHDEHRSVLVAVDFVTLTVQAEDGETGRAVQDGVAGACGFWLVAGLFSRLSPEKNLAVITTR